MRQQFAKKIIHAMEIFLFNFDLLANANLSHSDTKLKPWKMHSLKMIKLSENGAILTDDMDEKRSKNDNPAPSSVWWNRNLKLCVIFSDVFIWFSLRWAAVCHIQIFFMRNLFFLPRFD